MRLLRRGCGASRAPATIKAGNVFIRRPSEGCPIESKVHAISEAAPSVQEKLMQLLRADGARHRPRRA